MYSSTNQPPKQLQVDGAGDDEITLAFDTLTAAAAELVYSIHDVSHDGNYLFTAIVYQLESIGVSSTDDLDDAKIEEGDEHTRQITGGPRGSMLTIENLEADPQLLSVAPSEG